MWRSGDPASFAISAGEHFTEPFHRLLPQTDVGQGSNDVADHVLQECVRRDIERHPVALPLNSDMCNLAHRPGRLATSRPKRREIVLSQQLL